MLVKTPHLFDIILSLFNRTPEYSIDYSITKIMACSSPTLVYSFELLLHVTAALNSIPVHTVVPEMIIIPLTP